MTSATTSRQNSTERCKHQAASQNNTKKMCKEIDGPKQPPQRKAQGGHLKRSKYSKRKDILETRATIFLFKNSDFRFWLRDAEGWQAVPPALTIRKGLDKQKVNRLP